MVKFLRSKEFVLPCYVLDDMGHQALGFQGFKVIPSDYALLFPSMNGREFHMKNVGAPLLACGLEKYKDNVYRVASCDIWKPEGKCKYKGSDVLECNPEHVNHFKVGSLVYLEDSVDADKDPRLKEEAV